MMHAPDEKTDVVLTVQFLIGFILYFNMFENLNAKNTFLLDGIYCRAADY